jgi:NTE family protein
MPIFSGPRADIVPPLSSVSFLEDVPQKALKAAGREARWYSVPAGWPLFEAGEQASSIFFVLSGSFGAFRSMPDGRDEFVGHIRAGEPLGEMALFQGGVDLDGDSIPDDAQHSSSAYALKDSQVLELSRAGFDRLVKAEPELLTTMIRLILSRLRDSQEVTRRSDPKVFALVSTSPSIDIQQRAEALHQSLSRTGIQVRLVDAKDGEAKPAEYFDMLESQNDIVILVCSLAESGWSRLAMRQADRIWLVARADARPSNPLFPPDSSPAQALKLVDVLLVKRPGYREASQPEDWLNASGGSRVFHWNTIAGPECDRLARVMSGQSVGLVLSGGGARAYAHIGVIRALREKGIPIDFTGGASMGAVIAACVAIGWDDDEIDRRIRQAFVETNPLNDWTLPVVSMLRGRRVDRRLAQHFGDIQINHMDLPFFAVSTNLNTGTSQVHRRGLLSQALRASISLPGILPPVVENGDVLVDGAVLNNFPADIMRDVQRGFIIGSDVTRASQGLRSEDFINPPGFLGWVLRHGFSSPPPIAGLLMRSGTISLNPRAGRELVDVLVLPETQEVELRDWKSYDTCVTAGYDAAQRALTHLQPESLPTGH